MTQVAQVAQAQQKRLGDAEELMEIRIHLFYGLMVTIKRC